MLTTDNQAIVDHFNKLKAEVYRWAVGKGWWEDEERNFGELLMLVVTEIAEAQEENRVHGLDPSKFLYLNEDPSTICNGVKKPEGIAAELADAIIRMCDFSAHYDIPLGEAFVAKMEYNHERAYRHGGKNS